MSPTDLLPARGISDAKAKLPEVVSEAVHDHRPSVITKHGESQAVLISIEDELRALRSFVFEPRVVVTRDHVVMTLERHGLVSSAPSLINAVDGMVDELRAYSAEFLRRYEFYRHTSRDSELPWILRFALTPPEQQRLLLIEEPSRSAAAGS